MSVTQVLLSTTAAGRLRPAVSDGWDVGRTAFADRTVVTIAVSIGDSVDLLPFGCCLKIQYYLFGGN